MDRPGSTKELAQAGFRLFRCRAGCFHLSCSNQVTFHLSHAQLLALYEALEQFLWTREGELRRPNAAAQEMSCDPSFWLRPSETVALRLQRDEAVVLCELLRSGCAVLEEVPEPEWHSRYIM